MQVPMLLSRFLTILVVLMQASFSTAASKQQLKQGGGSHTLIFNRFRRAVPLIPNQSRFDRFLQKLYDSADTNHDGSISMDETYELVLKLYVNLNRQAPIPPPSREKVRQIFASADENHNNRISREEFKTLANILSQRAFSRLLAHKLVTLLGAPLLAEYTVRKLSGRAWLAQLAKTAIPAKFQEKALPVVTSRSFCRTILVIAFVISLGNLVLASVTWLLDMSLRPEKSSKKRRAHKK